MCFCVTLSNNEMFLIRQNYISRTNATFYLDVGLLYKHSYDTNSSKMQCDMYATLIMTDYDCMNQSTCPSVVSPLHIPASVCFGVHHSAVTLRHHPNCSQNNCSLSGTAPSFIYFHLL